MQMSEPRSDEQLLAALAWDPDAFADFYARYEDAVLAYFSRRVADRETVADLTAEVFSGVLLNAGQFDPDRGLAVEWLFGIAGKQWAMFCRRRRVERSARERLSIPPFPWSDESLERVEELSAVAHLDAERLLAGLPGPQRDAVRARVLDEAPYREIARSSDTTELVVRKRVSRGLATLRKRLRGVA